MTFNRVDLGFGRLLPVYPQLRTCRCIALNDAEGHFRTHAPQQNAARANSCAGAL